MKLVGVIIAGVLVLLVAVQLVPFLQYEKRAASDLKALQKKIDEANAKREELQADIDYYAKPENIEKELKARFNYKNPGETLLIIVPKTNASGTATTTP